MQPIVDILDPVIKIAGAIIALVVFFKFLILCNDIFHIRHSVKSLYYFEKARMVEDGLYDQANQRIKKWKFDEKTGHILLRDEAD